MPASPLSLVEFPADDVERARGFWEGLLAVELEARREGEGEGWQTHSDGAQVGVHARGRGPGDTWSLPYFAVSDMDARSSASTRSAAASSTRARPGRSAGTPRAARSGWPPLVQVAPA